MNTYRIICLSNRSSPRRLESLIWISLLLFPLQVGKVPIDMCPWLKIHSNETNWIIEL